MTDIKQQLKTAYDADATRRDEDEKNRADWKIRVREEFINLLRKENKKSILELGSGPGVDSKYFMDQGFDVLATDLSPEMVKMCRKRNVPAKVLDLYKISSLGKKFDGIYSLNVLLHTPRTDLQKVLSGIHNALNDDGIFFYGVYGGSNEEKTIIDKTKMGLPRFFSFMTDETLQEEAKKKFEVIKFEAIDLKESRPGFHFQSLFLRKHSKKSRSTLRRK